MTCYAVIDTNILVSAMLTSHEDAATLRVMKSVFTGDVIPLFSNEILAEYYDVLRRKKFNFSEERVNTFIAAIMQLGEMIEPLPSGETLIDMKDLPFYEVALSTRDVRSFLVTGNMKHFPQLPYIVTAAEFMNILENSNA